MNRAAHQPFVDAAARTGATLWAGAREGFAVDTVGQSKRWRAHWWHLAARTKAQLTDPSRRPPVPRAPVARDFIEHHFRETVVLARSCAGDQPHLRSHPGPGFGAVFHGSPTGPEFQVQPMHFWTLVLERLRLPLLLTEARCECGGQNHIFGRHRAACPRSGRLKRRAVPTERTLA